MKRLITIALVGIFIFCGNALAISTNGLVAYYPFSGNAIDESLNSNDGIVEGATLAVDRFGNADHAFSFDGIDDYIEILYNPITDITGWAEGTAAIWFMVDSLNDFGTLFGDHGNSDTNAFFLSVNSDNSMTGSWRDGVTEYYRVLAGQVTAGDWHHLALVYDGDSALLYLDGSFLGEDNTPEVGGISNVQNNLTIGSKSTGTNFFPGYLDDAVLYNRALSVSEISELFNASNPVPEPTTMLLLGTDLIGLAGIRRRMKS